MEPEVVPAEPVAAGHWWLPAEDLDRLLDSLRAGGRAIIGPTIHDDAIILAEIDGVAALPSGWGAEASPGRYRLIQRDDTRRFDHAVGPMSWKRWTFPPRAPIRIGRRRPDGVAFTIANPEPRPLAFVGVRACEIAAMAIQDRVLLDGPAVDGDYRARRAAAFIVAVECATPTSTCFCTSAGTGPEVSGGFDIALTELDDGYVVRVGTARGATLIDSLDLPSADPSAIEGAGAVVAGARRAMGPQLDLAMAKDGLASAPDHPGWAAVAERCLACANCTLVCPTCFCTSVVQRSDLDGTVATAERTWDSCFTDGFSRVAGGSFRPERKDRYRQWLTHKFSTWWDQFGSTGCVGCGRCIAWCPVGIDVRQELAFIAGVEPVTAPAASDPVPVLLPIGPAPAAFTSSPLAPESFVTARVAAITRETADTVTLRLETRDARLLAGSPGQFVMAALPAMSAAPISISRFRPDGLELTIRAAGPATRALTKLDRRETLGLRGPLGRGWPLDVATGRDVVIVAGGIGLAPLRPLIDACLARRESIGSLRLYLGARTPADRLYVAEIGRLAARSDIEIAETVDRAGADWFGRVGIVTQLFDRATWDGRNAVAFICGPERMMQATAEVLYGRGLEPDRTWVTLERNMSCGVGLCGHCQLGRFFVCRDGPVFSLAELGPAFSTRGL